MAGATAEGEMVVAPTSGDGFAKRRVALVAGIVVVLFGVAFGAGSLVKSHTAQPVSSVSLAATTPAAASSHLAIVKVQATAVPGLRRPVHTAVTTTTSRSTSTPTSGQTAVTSAGPQVTQTTPVVSSPPAQTLTTPPPTHTTQAQTSTSGGGLNGGSS
jgi:hypothetical protein